MAGAAAPILAQIQSIRDSLSPETSQNVRTRTELLQAAKKSVADLESPGDICERVVYQVSAFLGSSIKFKCDSDGFSIHQYVEVSSVQTATDLGIFSLLKDSESPGSTADLAKETKADPVLMGSSCSVMSRLCTGSLTSLIHRATTAVSGFLRSYRRNGPRVLISPIRFLILSPFQNSLLGSRWRMCFHIFLH